MKTITFKTNINCGSCVANVTPVLNNLPNVSEWNANTASPQKILQVAGSDELHPSSVLEALEKAGYKAELMENTGA